MISIKDTRQKLNWTQQDLSQFLKIERTTLSRAEASNSGVNPNVQFALLNLRLGIHHVDSFAVSSDEAASLVLAEKNNATAELKKQLEKTRVQWQRNINALHEMKSKCNVAVRALNYLFWFQSNPKGLTPKQRELIKLSIDLEKKNLQLFGTHQQSLLNVKIASLETEINILNSLIGVPYDIFLATKQVLTTIPKTPAKSKPEGDPPVR